MAITKDAVYEYEFNALTTDMVDGYPPETEGYENGSRMYVWNDTTKEIDSIFKLVNGSWYSLG